MKVQRASLAESKRARLAAKRAELHMHSRYSEHADTFLGADTSIENIVKTCEKKDITIFSITDHNTIAGHDEARYWAKKYGLLFVPGAEISTNSGHMLALGITRLIPQHLSFEAAIAAIHEQGGVAVAAHPFQIPYGCLWQFVGSSVDAIEAYHAYALGNGTTRLVNRFAKKTELAGSDAHYLDEIGLVYTAFPSSVRTVSDVLAAIRTGTIGIGGKEIGILQAMKRRLGEKFYV